MKLVFKYILCVIACFSGVVIFNNCATVSRPDGGDKDTVPPFIVFADPPFYTTNFDQKRVNIGFNEYVKLNKVEKELIISPPMEKNPKIWMKGKGIYFELEKDKLVDSATYIFNFGNSVVDNNEGNPYFNLTYVFSTGTVIDSFGISGRVIDAFTLKPSKEPFSVMLYDNLNDSTPLREKPKYIGRTFDDGSYAIEHIKPGRYRLFALKENNGNFKYDHPSEVIGFSDSVIVFDPAFFKHQHAEKPETVDSIKNGSIFMAGDSVTSDSIKLEDEITDKEMTGFKIYGSKHDFVSFAEENTDTLQRLKKSGYIDNRMLYFSFNQPVTDSFSVLLQYFPEKENWALQEFSIEHDSINFWITDTALTNMDTINIIVSYLKPDSMFLPVLARDTLKYRKTRTGDTRKRLLNLNEEEEKKVYLVPKFNIANNRQAELNDKLFIDFTTPVNKVDTSRVKFYKYVDTLLVKEGYTITPDSIKANRLHFGFNLAENSKYRAEIFDSAFIDIFGLANDTLYHSFSTKRLDQYGLLNVGMEGVDEQVVLQLLNSKEKVVDYRVLEKNETVGFQYIIPGEYILKVIFDENRNGKWDTGNYLKKVLPEKVAYFETVIKVRENWDHAENWDLKQRDTNNIEPVEQTE